MVFFSDTIYAKEAILFVTSGEDRATNGGFCDSDGINCSYTTSLSSLETADSNYLEISSFLDDIPAFWPSGDFSMDRYLQFNFSDGLDLKDSISSAKVKIIYKTNQVSPEDAYGAKVVISDDDNFDEDVDLVSDVTFNQSISNTNQTFSVSLGGNYLDPSILSQLKARFYLYGTAASENDSGVITSFDQVVLDVVSVDKDPPTNPLGLSVSHNPTNSTTQTWSWQAATDSDSGIKGYWYRLSGDSVIAATYVGNVLSWDTSLLQGQYNFFVKAEDNSGNQSGEVSSTLTVDTTKPTNGSLIINDGALYTNQRMVKLSISASDNLTDVVKMNLYNGSAFNDKNWETFLQKKDWQLPDTDGTKTVRIRFRDGAGNENDTYVAVDTIILDRINPASSADAPLFDNGGTIPISYSVSDSGSGIDKTRLFYRKNGGGWIDSGLSSLESSGVFVFDPAGVEGTYDFYSQATDKAGNTEPAPEKADSSLVFDFTFPTSSIISPVNNGTDSTIYVNSWDGWVMGTSDDSLAGISAVELSTKRSDGRYWNGIDWAVANLEEPRFKATGLINWDYLLPALSEDSYQIVSHAVDKAGNIENSYRLTIVLDQTVPEIKATLDSINSDNWSKVNPTISLAATDANIGQIQYQWDAIFGNWIVYDSPFSSVGQGDHTLYYRAFDKAGNVSQTGTKKVRYDQEGLERGPQNVSASLNSNTGNTAKIKWDEAKDNVGIDKYEINWSLDGTATSYTISLGGNVREYEIDRLDKEGKWNITVTAFDFVGNNKSGSTELTINRYPQQITPQSSMKIITPQVLGESITVVPTERPSPSVSSQVLGDNKTQSNLVWWPILALFVSGSLLVLPFFRRK